MKKYVKMAGFGILTWLIPFILSMVFYTPPCRLGISSKINYPISPVVFS